MTLQTTIRILMTIVFLVLFVFFLLPLKAYIINVGNIAGALISGILALVCIFWERSRTVVSSLWERGFGKFIVCAVGGMFSICTVLAVVISSFMIAEMNDKPDNRPTTLVVLGCQIKLDQPSRMLKRRLDKAYGYLAEHEDVCVVVSGGQGSDEITSEADVMRNYLVSRGISESRIFTEDKSVNTRENIRFSKEIIEENGLCADITIVTDGFHQLRGDIFARREGLKAYNISAATEWWLLPTYWVREWFGILYYTIISK